MYSSCSREAYSKNTVLAQYSKAKAPHPISSVAQSCPTLFQPMDYSTPGLPVQHQLPELAQTHAHRVGDAIQPLQSLGIFLLPPSIFPSIRVFSNESILHIRWPEHWSFSFSIGPSNEHSGLISLRMACLALLRAAIRFYLQGCDGHSAAQRIASVRRTMFPWLNGQHYFIITQHCGHLKDRRKLSADQVSSQMNHSYSYRNRYLWSRY